MENEYDVIQFSGHSDKDYIDLVDESNYTSSVPIAAIRDLVEKKRSINCLILMSCESGGDVKEAIAPYTVVMDAIVTDDVANAYSTGFYDALAAGRSYESAHEEGVAAVQMADLDASYIRLISK